MKKLKGKKEFIQYHQQEFLVLHEIYNEQEQPIQIQEYDHRGSLVQTISMEYDQDDLLKTEKYTFADGRTQTIHHEYDHQQMLTRVVIDFAHGEKIIKYYQRDGNREDISIEDESGNVEGREVTIINEQGLPIELYKYDQDNILTERNEFAYNEDGLLILEKVEDEVLYTSYTFESEYDEYQRLIAQKFLDDVLEEKWIYEYEEPEKQLAIGRKYIVSPQKTLVEQIHTQYNEAYLPIETKTFNPNGIPDFPFYILEITQRFEYTFWEE